MDTLIKSFIKHLIEEDYAAANKDLEKCIHEKIKIKIQDTLNK